MKTKDKKNVDSTPVSELDTTPAGAGSNESVHQQDAVEIKVEQSPVEEKIETEVVVTDEQPVEEKNDAAVADKEPEQKATVKTVAKKETALTLKSVVNFSINNKMATPAANKLLKDASMSKYCKSIEEHPLLKNKTQEWLDKKELFEKNKNAFYTAQVNDMIITIAKCVNTVFTSMNEE